MGRSLFYRKVGTACDFRAQGSRLNIIRKQTGASFIHITLTHIQDQADLRFRSNGFEEEAGFRRVQATLHSVDKGVLCKYSIQLQQGRTLTRI